MSEPKTAKDMEQLANEVLYAIIRCKETFIDEKGFGIDLSRSITAISHYLLDVYNQGYDDCIIETSKLKVRT